MLYRELEPCRALRGSVACLWLLDHAAPPGAPAEKILPDGRTELIFNLGAPYRRRGADGRALEQPRGFVVGQLRSFVELLPRGHATILGVRLEPPALQRLLGLPMSALTDRFASFEELGQRGLLELEARLHAATDWPARVRLVNEHLGRRLGDAASPTARALELIRRRHGRVELARVAGALGWSTRTLDRRFAGEVGIGPRLFARQVRLQRVFELLSCSPRPAWSEVALASGCYDQAHLNREFRVFAGESPEAFVRARHELSDHLTGLHEVRDAGRRAPA